MMPRIGIIVLNGVLVLTLGHLSLLALESSSVSTTDQEERVTFESALGGFEVEIPPSWNVLEIPRESVYQGFLSREKIEKATDTFLVGLSVTRLRDYRDAFTFRATTPKKISLEYANRIAAGVGQGSTAVVVGMRGTIKGMKSYGYSITAGKDENCLNMVLVVGMKRWEWFHALWEAPCSVALAEGLIEGMMDMSRTIKVSRQWGEKGP
jgi:hypothetical protein